MENIFNRIYSLFSKSSNFDEAINVVLEHEGGQRALKILGCYIVEDGIFGKKTISTINLIYFLGHNKDLMTNLRNLQADFYNKLVKTHPQLNVFLNGWLKRASF